jgi:hypothetical protein
MRRRLLIGFGVVAVFVIGWFAYDASRPREPVYKGKQLSQWLDEYNRAANLTETEPAAEAIRAMGTNALPFLLANLKHNESPLQQKLRDLCWAQHFVTPPFPQYFPYYGPSVMAFGALGSNAAPAFPELLELAANIERQPPNRHLYGMMALLAIGPPAVPTLGKLCESTNTRVRALAALLMAKAKNDSGSRISWGWYGKGSGYQMLSIGYAVSAEDARAIVDLLDAPEAAVRRASAEALTNYTKPPYAMAAQAAVKPLLKLLHDPDADVRTATAASLQVIDPTAVGVEK